MEVFCYEGLALNHVRVFFTKEITFSKSIQGSDKEFTASASSALYRLLRECEVQLHKSNVPHIRIQRVTFFYSPSLATFSL